MSIFFVPLKEYVVDPHQAIDLTSIPTSEAIAYIKKGQGFLANAPDVSINDGIIRIEFPEESKKKVEEALDYFQRGIRKAKQGDHKGAIQLLSKTLGILPYHTEARRNLAMANLELGDVEEARNQLIDVLRLDPKDAWGYLLLGNTYFMSEKDHNSAEPFYKKAYELTPDDAYLLNNYAALKTVKNNFAEARAMFERAIEANPSYPNSYVGLALLLSKPQELEAAVSTLESLFVQSKSPDIRSTPVYDQARSMMLNLHREIAERDYDSLMRFIEERKKVVESVTGFPVEIERDDALKGVTAKTQLAWKTNRTYHKVIYRENHPSIVPHLLAHELEHIILEYEARSAAKNKLFVTTDDTTKKAIESLGEERWKLRQSGLPAEEAHRLTLQWVTGLTNQLFNCPLDMVIEYRLHRKFPQLRSTQFVSLHATQTENAIVVTDKEIPKVVPRRIYQANVTMNASYALFTDWLYNNATEYTGPYRATNVFATGQKLFQSWLDVHDKLEAGDEFSLVETFAKILKLEDWFEFRHDEQLKEFPQGTTNPELLKAKEPATVMYLVGALDRFENAPMEEITAIASEIGLLGTTGIDFTKADKRYSLKSIPNEQFSGLQLLCLMYVGFKKIDPTMDTGLDFKDAYEMALKLYKPNE